MTGMADQHHITPGATVARDLEVNFGHQRTGRIEDFQATPLGFLTDRLGYAMRTKNDRIAVRYLVKFLDENCPTLLKIIDVV